APESSYALKVVVPDRGLPYVGFGEAGGGWVEAAGDAAGVAVGQASGPTQPNQGGFRQPIPQSGHPAPQYARSTAEAIDYFGGIVHAGKGLNVMIGDASGNLVAIERGHDRQVVRRPADEALYFANHYVTPEMRAAVASRTDQENSEGR